MAPGTSVTLGDREFVIPPITLGMLRGGLLNLIKEADELATKEDSFGAMVKRGDVILACFRKNYKVDEISDEEFFSRIDMGNFLPAWMAAMGMTAGEAVPAIEDGTSMVSTPLSPAPTAGTTGL